MMLAPSTRRSGGEGNCPVCGSPVQVVGDPVEGTMHYEPVVTDEMIHRALRDGWNSRDIPGYPYIEQTGRMRAALEAALRKEA